MVNNRKIFLKRDCKMLFSELNKINLNVLIQDSPYEAVPDISACYVHNAVDWTIFCNQLFDETDATPKEVESTIIPGWNVTELSCETEELEQTYLYRALTDISASLIDMSTDISSDLVKVYGGKFAPDGTFDYDAILNNEGLFEHRCIEPLHHYGHRHHPFENWWTFNNGAFQWIGGWPKSIYECRFSYGPFYGGPIPPPPPVPKVDQHHFDTNTKMIDNVMALSFLPNLIFIFDEWHILKGIISLPCATTEIVQITKDYISNLLKYLQDHFSELTFKNIDNVIKNFGHDYMTIPNIRVAKRHKPQTFEEPIEAIISFSTSNKISIAEQFKFILPDKNDFPTFFEKSYWKEYFILDSFHLPKTVIPDVDKLVYSDNMKKIIDVVNGLNSNIQVISYSLAEANKYTLLSESYLAKTNRKIFRTSLMSISDLFRNAKLINGLQFADEDGICIIVLPTGFCDKESFKFIANVKYL